jgi:protein-tyrosine phosphatase
MAESIFRHRVNKAGLEESFLIESAGTGNWHVGDNPDPRTIKVLAGHGIHDFSRARQVRSSDFEVFDHIVAMDMANERDLMDWVGSKPEKISLMSSWNLGARRIEVPDPYYGTQQDFEEVFEMLDEASASMLLKLQKL